MQDGSFVPTSTAGLAAFRASFGDHGVGAVDGGLIFLPDPQDHSIDITIGGWWLMLDARDSRTGHLHTMLDETSGDAGRNAARATDVERYIANLLVASRRLDVVHLVRDGGTIDYREAGKRHDQRLADTLAAIRARSGARRS
jgi:hypothetical protein